MLIVGIVVWLGVCICLEVVIVCLEIKNRSWK